MSDPPCTHCPDTCVSFCKSGEVRCGVEGESFARLHVVIVPHDLSQFLVLPVLPNIFRGIFFQPGEEMSLLMSLSAATLGWVTFCFPEEGKLTCCHVASSVLPSVTNSSTLSIFQSSPLVASCISSRVYHVLIKEEQGRMNLCHLV